MKLKDTPTHHQDKSAIHYYIIETALALGGIAITLFCLAVIFGLLAVLIY